jgi:hypothetical protein
VLLVLRHPGQRKHERLFLCLWSLVNYVAEHWLVPDRERCRADRARWRATWDRIMGPYVAPPG